MRMITALVISGGGSKGAFADGNVNVLIKQYGIDFDILVGTSTGSLIVPLAAFGEKYLALLEKMYTSIHTKDVVITGNLANNLMNNISLVDATPLKSLIEKYYTYQICTEILKLDKQIFLCTTCRETKKAAIFCTKEPPLTSDYEYIKIRDTTMLRRAILASCCQPVYMQPVEINGRHYVDGGVVEYCGVQIAIDAGADEIYAITLKAPEEIETKIYENSVEMLLWTLDTLQADVQSHDFKMPKVHNDALSYIEAVKQMIKQSASLDDQVVDHFFNLPGYEQFNRKPIKIHHIYPDKPLGGGPGGLTFDPIEMSAMVVKGERRCREIMQEKNDLKITT